MGKTQLDIQQVFDAYERELGLVEARLMEMFQSEVFLIPLIGKHLIKSGGKRMRPLFVILAAKLCGMGEGARHIELASIIESVHTASLLHDDVIDNAESRRGQPSANSIWSNQVVILVGDFLYSNALKLTIAQHDHWINETLSSATTRMTQGELLQLQQAKNIDITEEQYLSIVSAKTGALISAATSLGGISAGCSAEQERALGAFGLIAGNAFQIADDILDYSADEAHLGKKLGKDLDEGKVTLPLIYLIKRVTASERDEVAAIVESDSITEANLSRIIELLKKYNAIEEASARARALVQEAKDRLMIFPDCEPREHLFMLADYALMRGK